jgi:hypothetical protein
MEASTRSTINPLRWNWSVVGEVVQEYAGTVLVLLLITNGLATFLIMFDKLVVSTDVRHFVGALSLAFSVLVVGWAVHRAIRSR